MNHPKHELLRMLDTSERTTRQHLLDIKASIREHTRAIEQLNLNREKYLAQLEDIEQSRDYLNGTP